MEQVETFLIFTERLERAGIKYVVTGSVAAMAYGYPRLTADLDLVVELNATNIPALIKAFPQDKFYCPPEEVLRIESARRRRGHFNIIHHNTGYKADMYLCGQDPLHHWALAKASKIDISDEKGIWVAPPEYVIVRKLEYYREGGSEKHLSDIVGMFDVSGESIDTDKILQQVKKRNLQASWEKIEKMMSRRMC